MMKKLFIFLLLNGLFITTAQARNCAQALHNKHCTSSSGVSALTSQGSTVIGSTGQSPNPAQTNAHLGSGSTAQNQVVKVYPLPPTVITGTSLVTLQALTAKPHTFTGQNVQVQPLPPTVITGTSLVTLQTLTAKPHTFTGQNVQVNPVPTPIITGTSAGPLQPIITAPPKTFTGQNVQVNPVPTPIITGTSAGPLQPVIIAPPKTFTGQNVQVNPVPTPIITGTSAGPLQPITTAPPKTFTGQNVQVNPVPTPIITGTSAGPLQPITTAQPKTFTGQTQQVYPIATPILIGNAAVPVKPVMNVPPQLTTQTPSKLPYNVPPLAATPQPVVTKSPMATPNTPTIIAPPKPNTVPPSQQPLTPVLITHVASSNLHPHVLLQQQMLHGSSDLKSLEPHIKGLPVDVYTGKNVHKTTYEKSTSINSKGFHLTVLGVKEPTFVDTTPLPVAVKPDDIIFNFSYASAEIHKDQLSQIDKIIAVHSKNGKRIILMGETDGFGSETYNKHLAVLRANKIIDELKARGANVDDVEIRILVRCCRKDHPNKETLAETREQRITWVHFQ